MPILTLPIRNENIFFHLHSFKHLFSLLEVLLIFLIFYSGHLQLGSCCLNVRFQVLYRNFSITRSQLQAAAQLEALMRHIKDKLTEFSEHLRIVDLRSGPAKHDLVAKGVKVARILK